MKQTKKINLLKIIFLVSVIPVITVYLIHSTQEFDAFSNTTSKTKATKTLGEGILFMLIGLGYITASVFVFVNNNRIACYVILVGTVSVVILYWLRLYGIPVPGTEIIIKDFTADWMDVITKIGQQVLTIPVSMLLVELRRSQQDS